MPRQARTQSLTNYYHVMNLCLVMDVIMLHDFTLNFTNNKGIIITTRKGVVCYAKYQAYF